MMNTSAVPAPPGLVSDSSQSVDTMQDLINRKREADRNKFKYHLTEADCNLLSTHGVVSSFAAGQIIVEVGAPLTKAYRIKSGKVGVFKGDIKVKELTRGYFIGETLLVRSNMTSMLGFGAVAETYVEVIELNLPFIKQLLSVDKTMAFKVYRHLASKLSGFLFLSLSHIAENTEMQTYVLNRHLNSTSSNSDVSSDASSDTGSMDEPVGGLPSSSSISSTSSTSSSSFSSSSSVSTTIPIPKPDSPTNVAGDDVTMQVFLKLKQSKELNAPRKVKHTHKSNAPFRTFTLDPHGHVLLFPGRLKFTCTLRQRKVKYNHILDITKVGPVCITIIYKLQAKTIFFKTPEETDEFLGLVKSLRLKPTPITSPTSFSPPPLPSSPLDTSAISPLSMSYDDVTESDKVILNNMCVKQELKRGEVVIAEGDLYQRVYTVVQGQISSFKGERQIMSIEAGETFGVLTLFHLRPSSVNLVVTSDTATVLIIPGYRYNELVTTNFPLAVRMHKKAAQLIYSQIEYVTTGSNSNPDVAKDSNRAMV